MTETVLMGSFGENLRREREMRGVTLEEISAATKISIRFLKCIEDEDFSKLPGGLFNRSFIRAYARYLGLDEDPVVAEYQLAAKTKGEVDLTRMSAPAVYSSRKRSSRPTWVGVAAAVVLLFAGYGLWRHARAAAESPSPVAKQLALPTQLPHPGAGMATSASAASAARAPSASAEPQTSAVTSGNQSETSPPAPAVVATAASPGPGLAVQTSANADNGSDMVLQIATTERAWVAIDADGKTVMQGIMNPNEVKTLKAKDSFDVLTGNARGVVLTLNGRTLKPLGREGEVKSIHLTRDDLKNQTSP